MRSVIAGIGLSVLSLVFLGPGARGQTPGTLKLENAWARRAPMAATGGGHGGSGATGNGAVYVKIVNDGPMADALVSATSEAAAKVELHETRSEGGVMRMHPLPRFDVPAGGALEMRPGGHHVMLLGLTRALAPGDIVRVILTFERAGVMQVEAPVR